MKSLPCLRRDTDCRVASLLAMTGVFGSPRKSPDFHCHCEAPQGPWQSVLSFAAPRNDVRYNQTILTIIEMNGGNNHE